MKYKLLFVRSVQRFTEFLTNKQNNMIKVTVGEHKPQETKPFPKLMIHKETKNIVFFHNDKMGVVVVIGEYNNYRQLGEYRDDFIMETFTDFNEPITIKNA